MHRRGSDAPLPPPRVQRLRGAVRRLLLLLRPLRACAPARPHRRETEEKRIAIELAVAYGKRVRHWNLTFSNCRIFAEFFNRLTCDVESVSLVATRKDSAPLCTSLLKFDHCRTITAAEVELSTDEGVRGFGAWIRCQKRLLRLAISRMKFSSAAFAYLPPAVESETITELSLADVHFPEGGLGEVIRRVLDKGRIRKLTLTCMKLGELDAATLARTQPQQSLEAMELCCISFFVRCQLGQFVSRLRALQKLRIRGQSGSTFEAFAYSLPNLPLLEMLCIDCEDYTKLRFLPLILPAMPQLKELVVNKASLPLDSLTKAMEKLIEVTTGGRNND